MPRYQQYAKIAYGDADPKGQIKLPQLFNMILQVSSSESEKVGRSDQWMRDVHDAAWVVLEYQMQINRLPKLGEVISIETQAVSYNKFFCYRDFWIYDEKKALLCEIHSTWTLIDLSKRRIKPITAEIVAPYQVEETKKIYRSDKFVDFDADYELTEAVKFYDLDINQHVNNTKYMGWMIENLPMDFLMTHQLVSLHIKYLKEISPLENVTKRAKLEGLVSHHDIQSTQKHAQATMTWRREQ